MSEHERGRRAAEFERALADMTRQPAWTDASGLTHFRDAHGQVGRHKPGATCRCGPQMVPQEVDEEGQESAPERWSSCL